MPPPLAFAARRHSSLGLAAAPPRRNRIRPDSTSSSPVRPPRQVPLDVRPHCCIEQQQLIQRRRTPLPPPLMAPLEFAIGSRLLRTTPPPQAPPRALFRPFRASSLQPRRQEPRCQSLHRHEVWLFLSSETSRLPARRRLALTDCLPPAHHGPVPPQGP